MKIKILQNNFTQHEIDASFLEYAEKAAYLILQDSGHDYEIGLNIVTEEEIQELNEEYRHIDAPTDVLSFVLNDEEMAQEEGYVYLGDVVICLSIAKKQAQEYNHSLLRELVYLFVHSILHMTGYDHLNDEDKQNMRAEEERVMGLISLSR
ncbi:MAG: rRNA maturation RNase YbeY [Eubacteriaceae bacterium]